MEFERLKNTRDLGGLTMKDGRKIKPGMLIRSSYLAVAPAHDLAILQEAVSDIVDFRTDKERQERPDPVLEGVTCHAMPVLADMTAGVTREVEADRNEIEMFIQDPDGAWQHMLENYHLFVTAPHAQQCYSDFVKLLAAPRDKALLWHCTAGKDRAGFAAVIVLSILGADRETILADYMKTNAGLAREIQWIYPMIEKQAGIMTETMRKALDYMFLAREEYLLEAFRTAEEKHGSMDAYLKESLGVDDAMRKALQDRYLQD